MKDLINCHNLQPLPLHPCWLLSTPWRAYQNQNWCRNLQSVHSRISHSELYNWCVISWATLQCYLVCWNQLPKVQTEYKSGKALNCLLGCILSLGSYSLTDKTLTSETPIQISLVFLWRALERGWGALVSKNHFPKFSLHFLPWAFSLQYFCLPCLSHLFLLRLTGF